MYNSKSIKYVGVNDFQIDLFEGQYKVPKGMAYNSYVIIDEKIAVMDSVEKKFEHDWLENIDNVLENRKPDYLVVQHMEPDHSSSIVNFVEKYKDITIVLNQKALTMLNNFYNEGLTKNLLIVNDGDELNLGSHILKFIFAPMVHWPEVMVTYEEKEKVLFSADAFGKFGANTLNEEEWIDEARRYYIGIVGKYGVQVQNLLKKASALEINAILPLHGPTLNENINYYINLYNVWSSYAVEKEGVCICYTSIYGNTKRAVELLSEELTKRGCSVVLFDLARVDMSLAVMNAFSYPKLVLATTTYNGDIFPFMKEFVDHLLERNYQNRMIGIIENGSWAPQAIKIIKTAFEKSKNITWTDNNVSIKSAVNEENIKQISLLADELI